jgi:hypothetical protein
MGSDWGSRKSSEEEAGMPADALAAARAPDETELLVAVMLTFTWMLLDVALGPILLCDFFMT